MCALQDNTTLGSPVETVVRVPEWSLIGAIPGAADGEQAQLGPAVDLFTFELVDLGDVLLSRDTWGCDMSLILEAHPDAVAIGGVLDASGRGTGRWDGTDLRTGLWAGYGSGGVHMSTGRAGQVNAEIVVERDALDDTIATLGREPSAVDGTAFLLTPAEAADIAAVYFGAGFDGRKPDPEAARSTVLDAVARVFSAPSRSERPTTRGLSSRAIVMTAVEYARMCHGRRPSIFELCRAAAVSERRLMYAFQEMTGVSPQRYLTLVAMTHAHDSLLRGSPAELSVRDVAFDHGFRHLGRFAARYRQIYGELPSETLQRRG